MVLRKVIRMGDPVLRQVSVEVMEAEMATKELKRLIRDMQDTMQASHGVGLAAVQIGTLKRVILISEAKEHSRYPEATELKNNTPSTENTEANHQIITLINPKIIHSSTQTQKFWEGCLSIPDLRGLVERSNAVTVKYLDIKGHPCEIQAENFTAIVLQHEIDHLNGILYIDRLKDIKQFGFCAEIEDAQNSSIQ